MSVEQPIHEPDARMKWGSDLLAETLRELGFRYLSMTPGASFRGLHDSLVNHLHNVDPQLLTCIHEESAVALAHGYAKVTGEPMAVAVHSNVGLMHATMAIFNAWCDRVPMVIVGATGPMDAVERRPWVDWIHTGRDLGSLVRGYTKWDDQPGSPLAARESLLRANQIARTAPCGPTYVCLDAHDQERIVEVPREPIDVKRYTQFAQPVPSTEAIARAVERLRKAKFPLVLSGRSTRGRRAWDARVSLAERLGARVITDLRSGASFPTGHRLHPHRAGIYLDENALADIGKADVVLSLDWIDLAGTLRQAGGETAYVIHCSPDQYGHNGWSFDHLGLPAVDVGMLVRAESAVDALNAELERAGHEADAAWPENAIAAEAARGNDLDQPISIHRFARTVSDALQSSNPCYIRLPIGWPGGACDFKDPLDFLGYDGGGGNRLRPGNGDRCGTRAEGHRSSAGGGPGRRRFPDGGDGRLDGGPLQDSDPDRRREQCLLLQ